MTPSYKSWIYLYNEIQNNPDRDYRMQKEVTTMKSIVYVGMDVHTTNYTLACFRPDMTDCFAVLTVEPDCKNILSYLKNVEKNSGEPCEFHCGYEAGCLGFSLYDELQKHGISCVVLASSTMPSMGAREIKNDKRDAQKIARCLAYGQYSPVHVPAKEDLDVKEFLRMRNDHRDALKRVKQQILAFCTRHGLRFTDGKKPWTLKHLAWLRKLRLGGLLQEVLDEYLRSYQALAETLERLDKRIEELAQGDTYRENVKKLGCFVGIRTHTAMALLVETGDFRRFRKPEQYAAYLGLIPGERSSGAKVHATGITKTGNVLLRRLLAESAQCYSRGRAGFKSQTLRKRQSGNLPEVIRYADRANLRLRKKYSAMVMENKKAHNVAVTAIARELACFVWGMMTGNIA